MAQTASIPEAQDAAQSSAAELIIALPGALPAAAIRDNAADEMLTGIAPHLSAVVVHADDESAGLGLPSPGLPHLGGQGELLPWLVKEMETHGARACVVLGSGASYFDQGKLERFAAPVLEEEYDLALGHYPAARFSGLINKALIYPLTRALYGLRVHDPLAEDWAVSSRLASALMPDSGTRGGTLLSGASRNVTTAAICAGFRVCEVNTGFARPAPSGVEDLSSLLVDIVGPLFADMETTAGLWQRARGSKAARSFGEPAKLAETTSENSRADVDVREMVDTFGRGFRELFDIWAQVLSPRTLLELKKLARLDAGDFRFPDEAWARLVYEFCLGHRQRVMNRDHLLRSLTPLYLAWVASYANEVRDYPAEDIDLAVEQRLERLCLTFEVSKPYLVSRWRWPDRFNP